MEKRVVVIMISKRSSDALELQKILTEYGCIIKTRLGIHDGVADRCSEAGLIMLELAGEKSEEDKLIAALNAIKSVDVKDLLMSV